MSNPLDITVSKPKPVFLSVRAQHGNLGDFVIRRYVTDLVKESGGENHLLAQGVRDGFLSGLGLGRDAVIYTSTASWLRALMLTQFRGWRGILVFTPGPETLKKGALPSSRQLLNILLSVFMRLTGGRVMKIGRSISGGSVLSCLIERIQVRLTNHYTVRDHDSARLLKSYSAKVRPDVGFAARLGSQESCGDNGRDIVAFSFREDRVISRDFLSWLVSESRDLGLTPVFLSQVRQDSDFNAQLAKEYGADFLVWPTVTYEDKHLSDVLRVYGRAQAVVSNRLHSIVFGLRCGAAPIGIAAADDPKLKKTLSVIGLASYVVSGQDRIDFRESISGAHRERVSAAIRLAKSEREDTAALIA